MSEKSNGISYRLLRIVEWSGAFVTTRYDTNEIEK